MPLRKEFLATGETYHIFNRSIGHTTIFKELKNYQRLINLVEFYRFNKPPVRFSHFNRLTESVKIEFLNKIHLSEKLIDIYAFCLMPNHFHFLVKQLKDNGISQFTSNLQNAYAKYFNIKYQRTGSLFQSMFKVVRIETESQLIHVQRYIHLNPLTSYILKDFKELYKYKWGSFGSYTQKHPYNFINTKPILKLFNNKKDFTSFTSDQIEYQKQLHQIKNIILE